jgi:hypothetical protein
MTFKCYYCERTFATPYALKRHISDKHRYNLNENEEETSQTNIIEETGLWDDEDEETPIQEESGLWDDEDEAEAPTQEVIII